MAGFASSVSNNLDVVFAKNFDFSGASNPTQTITTNGQFPIGSTALNVGGTNINVGTIVSPFGTVTIGYSSPNITLDIAGAAAAIEKINVQTGTSPILPTGGFITLNGAVTAAGTNPVRTDGTASNTIAIEVQTSQALAAADATKIGLCNFDSSSFSVAATGFVTLSTTGSGKTITGDSGGALSPTANNWNIFGGPGVTTSGSGSTLTINSVVFTDTTAATLAVDNGYFATAAGTYVLPGAPVQGEIVIIVCDTAGAVVVDAPSTHLIRLGNQITSAGGTMTSTAIGDSLTLRYRASSTTWFAVSSIGNWTPA